MLKFWQVFLSIIRLRCSSWRKECALRPGFSAVGCEFNVMESTMNLKRSVFEQKCTWNEVLYWSVDENAETKGEYCISPSCNSAGFANVVSEATLWNVTTVNNKHLLHSTASRHWLNLTFILQFVRSAFVYYTEWLVSLSSKFKSTNIFTVTTAIKRLILNNVIIKWDKPHVLPTNSGVWPYMFFNYILLFKTIHLN